MSRFQNYNISTECSRLGLGEALIPVNHPVYYGQCAEDYIAVSVLRALASTEGVDLTTQRYLEIGANHPVSTSSTYLLHRGLGMVGVLVEANPSLLDALRKARPVDTVLQYAVTPYESSFVDFYVSDYSELSSIKKQTIENFPHIKASVADCLRVPAITINQLIERYFHEGAPLFVSVDVEGVDVDIIESWDLSVSRPYLIQVESSKDWGRGDYLRIMKKLTGAGYVQVIQTDVNLMVIDGNRLKRQVAISNLASVPTLPISMGEMARVISSVDVVSFDVFDTILARKCLNPSDVFSYIENKYAIPGFASARVAAEAKARKKFSPRGAEVSLSEIYGELKYLPNLPADMLEKEVEAEALFLFAKPEVVDFIAGLQLQGKVVVAITDMYLSGEQVQRLLVKNSVFVDRVYSSCDHRAEDLGKYNGKIFPLVASDLSVKPSKILHIGDNRQSDWVNARAAGCLAINSKKLSDIHCRRGGGFIFPPLKECASSSIVKGVLVAKKFLDRHGGDTSEARNFGYQVAGPLLAGFLKFLLDQALEKDIKQLLLLARDGVVVSEALNILKPAGISWNVLPASRRLTIFPLYAKRGWKAIVPLFGGEDVKLTPEEFLGRLVLDFPIPEDIKGKSITLQEFARVFDHLLIRQAEDESKAIRLCTDEYLQDEVPKFAWVDVGWALSSIVALNDLLGVDAPAYVVGSHALSPNNPKFMGYLFDKGAPENVCQAIMSAVEVVELIFSDISRSTAYLKVEGDGVSPVYLCQATDEVLRNSYISDVRVGAIEFIRDIKPYFDGLNSVELREYNRSLFEVVSNSPDVNLYGFLSQIPHDRMAGSGVWASIGDYWRPDNYGYADLVSRGQHSDVNLSIGNSNRLRLKFQYRMLLGLSKMTPFVPKRMAERFRRSAEKRRKKLNT